MPSVSRREALERRARVGEEVLLEQQVLGRVAGDASSGKSTSSAPGVARALDVLADLRRVAGDVADGGFDLGEREAQRSRHARIIAVDAPPEPGLGERAQLRVVGRVTRSRCRQASGDHPLVPGRRARITAWPAGRERGSNGPADASLERRSARPCGAESIDRARRCPARAPAALVVAQRTPSRDRLGQVRAAGRRVGVVADLALLAERQVVVARGRGTLRPGRWSTRPPGVVAAPRR